MKNHRKGAISKEERKKLEYWVIAAALLLKMQE